MTIVRKKSRKVLNHGTHSQKQKTKRLKNNYNLDGGAANNEFETDIEGYLEIVDKKIQLAITMGGTLPTIGKVCENQECSNILKQLTLSQRDKIKITWQLEVNKPGILLYFTNRNNLTVVPDPSKGEEEQRERNKLIELNNTENLIDTFKTGSDNVKFEELIDKLNNNKLFNPENPRQPELILKYIALNQVFNFTVDIVNNAVVKQKNTIHDKNLYTAGEQLRYPRVNNKKLNKLGKLSISEITFNGNPLWIPGNHKKLGEAPITVHRNTAILQRYFSDALERC